MSNEHTEAASTIIDAMKKAGLIPADGVANSLYMGQLSFIPKDGKLQMVTTDAISGIAITAELNKRAALVIASFLLPWAVSP